MCAHVHKQASELMTVIKLLGRRPTCAYTVMLTQAKRKKTPKKIAKNPRWSFGSIPAML